jgi:NifU-like protein involved in Fe-S cluster formation
MEANEQALLIQEYAKSTTYCHSGEIYNAHRHQGNNICGDDIAIYLYIVDDKVVKYSFDGNTSMITYASASFLGDLIV